WWVLVPWSLGLVKTVDPLLARTYFWWFGHPLVYFLLIPAYVVWYSVLRRSQAGGCSAILSAGWCSSSSWCCRRRSGFIISLPTPGSARAGSLLTRSRPTPSSIPAL